MALDMDKLRKEHAKAKKASEGGQFWKPQAGKNVVRIIPPIGDADIFWHEGAMHFNLGSESVPAAVCPGEDCPVCEKYEEMMKGSVKDQKAAKQIKAKKSYWMYVIDRGEPDRDIQLFRCGIKLFSDILGIFSDADYGDITDPKEGRDLTIEVSGKGLNTEYSARAKPATTSLSKTELKELKGLAPFEELETLKPREDLDEVLDLDDTEDEEEDDEEEEEETPKKKSKKKSSDDEEEEEEDEEESDDDEEEEEETPKKKSKKKPSDDEEEDEDEEEESDDDEEEDDDDEEEEAPKKKSKTVSSKDAKPARKRRSRR